MDIVETLMRGCLWRLRADDKAGKADARALITKLIGLSGLARLSATHMARKVGSETDNGIVEEREVAPLIVGNQGDTGSDASRAAPASHAS